MVRGSESCGENTCWECKFCVRKQVSKEILSSPGYRASNILMHIELCERVKRNSKCVHRQGITVRGIARSIRPSIVVQNIILILIYYHSLVQFFQPPNHPFRYSTIVNTPSFSALPVRDKLSAVAWKAARIVCLWFGTETSDAHKTSAWEHLLSPECESWRATICILSVGRSQFCYISYLKFKNEICFY